eukprot:Colp12_sorted_trinity150504_noHs@19010
MKLVSALLLLAAVATAVPVKSSLFPDTKILIPDNFKLEPSVPEYDTWGAQLKQIDEHALLVTFDDLDGDAIFALNKDGGRCILDAGLDLQKDTPILHVYQQNGLDCQIRLIKRSEDVYTFNVHLTETHLHDCTWNGTHCQQTGGFKSSKPQFESIAKAEIEVNAKTMFDIDTYVKVCARVFVVTGDFSVDASNVGVPELWS